MDRCADGQLQDGAKPCSDSSRSLRAGVAAAWRGGPQQANGPPRRRSIVERPPSADGKSSLSLACFRRAYARRPQSPIPSIAAYRDLDARWLKMASESAPKYRIAPFRLARAILLASSSKRHTQ